MEIRRCMKCMNELSDTNQYCPACGAKVGETEQPAYALKCNYILHGRYLIGSVLGQGGFGITYIGLDMTLNVKVAVKEYFPMGMVTRENGESSKILWNTSQMGEKPSQGGHDSFLKEARKMAKIDGIPSIVRVRDMFLDNDTAYIVMDFVEGITLKQKISREGPISFSECISLLRPMMEDLEQVHRQGMIHRDISPDNIMIQPDGRVRLLDLGAAKDMTAAQGVSSQPVAKGGFSPLEQYRTGGDVGPWTDVYALCATIYYCITGRILPAAFDRIYNEEISFPDSLKEPLSEEKKDALRAGLEVRMEQRTQSIEELMRQLDTGALGEEAAEGTWKKGKEACALRCGSILHERYLIGRVLGQGGFGITYIGTDMLLNIKVAIKEYFPMGMVARDPGDTSKLLWNPSQASQSQRQSGYNSFLKEARKMAKIDQIPSIVRVRDLFLENETAYIVMDFVEGTTLKQKLSQEGPMAFSECLALLRPMMEDLAKVHKQGMIHRDISPDNIMIRKDGKVRLLDLGVAKDVTTAHATQVVATKGFSPLEQYMDSGKVGPWTDVYALCSTIYYCITGRLLPDALERLDSSGVDFPNGMKEPLTAEAAEALRAGLRVSAEKRIQSVEELLRHFASGGSLPNPVNELGQKKDTTSVTAGNSTPVQ